MVIAPKLNPHTVMKKISEIYNKKACLSALISGLLLGTLFTIHPPYKREEPLTWQFACATFLIWVVFAVVLGPLFSAFCNWLYHKVRQKQ